MTKTKTEVSIRGLRAAQVPAVCLEWLCFRQYLLMSNRIQIHSNSS